MTAFASVHSPRQNSAPPEPTMLAIGLALVAATSGTARGLLIPGLKLSDILVVMVAAAALIRWGGRGRLLDGVGAAALAYASVYCVLTFLHFSYRPDLSVGALPLEIFAVPQYVLIYVLAYAIGQESRNLMTWFRPSMIIACIMAVTAVLQVSDVGPVREILAAATGRDTLLNPLEYLAYRGTAFFFSWHALGMYLCLHAVIAAACLRRTAPRSFDKRLAVLTLLLTGAGILTTATGTPAVIYAVAILVFLLRARNATWVVGGGILLVLIFSLTPIGQNVTKRMDIQYGGQSDTSLIPKSFGYRVDVWVRDYLPTIADNIWIGYGPIPEGINVFEHTESMYITLLLDGGIPLLVTFAAFFVVAFIRMIEIVRKVPQDDPSLVHSAAKGLLLVMVALAASMVIHPYLLDAGGAPMFFTSLGMISGLAYGIQSAKDKTAKDNVAPTDF